jgi:hypothetical protein
MALNGWEDRLAIRPTGPRSETQLTTFYAERVYTRGVEEFFSRMRRVEIGYHHHIAGNLVRYA